MTKKYMAISKELFEDMFTTKQQEEIKNTLRAYNEVHVTYEHGKYNFSTMICVTKTYAPDHEFCGTVYADDIFTPEERMINYMESFHDYPIEYNGKRDYKMLKEIGFDWSIKFKMENGNLVRA